jgi:hypothetical protein
VGIKRFKIERMASIVSEYGKEGQLGAPVSFPVGVNRI